MILIAHRGNINGSIPELENKPEYINKALKLGYDVEIDVWFKNNKYYLGHDKPQYEVNINFLKNKKLWCHAKNILALSNMIEEKNIHCFYHDNDAVVLTSRNFLWTFPGNYLTKKSICVESNKKNIEGIDDICYGLCSDYVGQIKC